MTSWLDNVNGYYANLRHKAELAEYDFLVTFFIYNEMNAICVGLLELLDSCIQFSNEPLITGTVQDDMPLVLHYIEQSNHSACMNFFYINKQLHLYVLLITNSPHYSLYVLYACVYH